MLHLCYSLQLYSHTVCIDGGEQLVYSNGKWQAYHSINEVLHGMYVASTVQILLY